MQEQIKNSILECIGETPIVRLNKMIPEHVKQHEFLVKVEFTNPGSSIKDRIALTMVEEAEKNGELVPGGTIVECTSGNTGMGLAMVAVVKGYQCVCVMPDKVSSEKIKILEAMGARVVTTPTAVEPDDPRSYYSVAKKIAKETDKAFYVNQYHNPANPLAHYKSTGPEIYRQLGDDFDYLVVASGTGGTLCGTAKYLHEQKVDFKSICVDPIGSIYYDFFKTGDIPDVVTSYKVEGFGEDFMPSTIDFELIDDVVQVSDQECFDATRVLARQEGIFAGGSCGGAIAGAIKYAESLGSDAASKRFLIVLSDSGSRYVSKVYSDEWLQGNGFEV